MVRHGRGHVKLLIQNYLQYFPPDLRYRVSASKSMATPAAVLPTFSSVKMVGVGSDPYPQ